MSERAESNAGDPHVARTLLLEVLWPAFTVGAIWVLAGRELAVFTSNYWIVGLIDAGAAAVAGVSALIVGRGVNRGEF